MCIRDRPYVFLIGLFASQYSFYREKDFRRKIKEPVTETLKKESNKIPSLREIHQRSSKIVYYRGVSIIMTAICILGVMIYFQEF